MQQQPHPALATVLEMTRRFSAGDIDGVLATYEPDAAVAFEPGQPTSDGTTIRDAFTQMAAAAPRFDYAGHDLIVQGDLALHVAPWTMQATGPQGEPVTARGLSVAVLRRQASGEWRLVIDNPHGQHLMPPA